MFSEPPLSVSDREKPVKVLSVIQTRSHSKAIQKAVSRCRSTLNTQVAEEDGNGGEEEGEDDWVLPELCHFAFLARRPFHPGRLHKLLNRGGRPGVLRSKGSIWIASHPEDSILWSQVPPHTRTHLTAPSWALCLCKCAPNNEQRATPVSPLGWLHVLVVHCPPTAIALPSNP